MAGFQLKDFVSIVAGAINHAKATQTKVTDFEVGSVIRTMIESAGIELDELYQKFFAGVLDAIPTAIYKAFDFELIGQTAASGKVRLAFAGPIVEAFTIPAGTIFDSPTTSLKFTSTADVLVPIGATNAVVVVACTTPGTIGNVAAGAITSSPSFTMPVGTVISNDAFTSGVDEQTEAERKARFVEFILSLSRGTPAALRYAVKQAQVLNPAGVLLEYVTRIGMDESPGYVKIFIYGSGGLPSAELVATAQRIVDGMRNGSELTPGYRAGGVKVEVLAMAEREIPVSLKVKLYDGLQPSDAIKSAIATVLAPEFEAVESGEVLEVVQLTDAALTVSGVQKVTSSNTENVPCADYEVLRLGALTVEWANA